ncbi:hypothetical protein QN277_027381 [Acacia crassicarpa]|uniref:Uncharacterized protein n=1 Tax=Acacia crassicarpa TaxID=499986 RepID=A0AAE1K7X1_9FABA|nr:hypothetical protein QN277_027381 [Acacia crassicarpa]
MNVGTPFTVASWAAVSYTKVVNKDDVVVALFLVKMIRTNDGQIILLSHHDLSEAVFNYCHHSVVDFRTKLNHLSVRHITPDNVWTASTSHSAAQITADNVFIASTSHLQDGSL